jgi:hypothetical protein
MGNVQAVVGDAVAVRRTFEVEVKANDAALGGLAPGRPLFVDVVVTARIVSLGGAQRAWLFLHEEGSAADPREGDGEVGSRIETCTDPRTACGRRFRVSIAFSGASAGQEGIVSWQVVGKVAGSGAVQPPGGAGTIVTIRHALPDGRVMARLGDLAKAARASPGAAAPSGTTAWRATSPITDLQGRTDGSILVRDEHGVTLLDGAGTKALGRFDGARSWSPDGDWVIGAANEHALRLWNVGAVGAPRELEVGAHEGFAVSSGGKWVGVTGANALRMFEVETGRVDSTVDGIDSLSTVRFADTQLSDITTMPVVVLMTTRSEEPWKVFSAAGANLRDLIDGHDAYLDDGWRVFREGSRLSIARAAAPMLEAALDTRDLGVHAQIGGPVVDGAGQRIAFPVGAYPTEARSAQVVVASLADGAVQARWPDVTGPLGFSPDGRRLIGAAGDRIRILDVATRAELTPP